MDYFNPDAGLTPASTYAGMPGGGFMTGFTQGMNQQTTQPFRETAKLQQNLALQSAMAKFQEEQSPLAKASRQSKLQLDQTQNESTLRTLPFLERANIAKHNAYIKTLPSETRAAIAKASEEARQNEGKPLEQWDHDIADTAIQIAHTKDPIQKAAAWAANIQKMKLKGVPVPTEMEKWTPENESAAQLKAQGLIHNVAQQQKLEAEKAKQEAETARARETAEIQARAHVQGAGIAAAASKYGADVRAVTERPVRPDMQFVIDQKTIDSPVRLAAFAKREGLDEEAAKEVLKARIESYKEEKAAAEARKRTEMRVNSGVLGGPDKGRNASEIYDEELAKVTGKSPIREVGSVADLKKQHPEYANIPDETLKKAYKAKTGKDLK